MKRPAPLSSSSGGRAASSATTTGKGRAPAKAKAPATGATKPKTAGKTSTQSKAKTASKAPAAAKTAPKAAAKRKAAGPSSKSRPKSSVPSAPAKPPRARRAPEPVSSRRVDVRGWLGGLRLSGFTVIMLGLVILAVCVLVPTVSTYVGQQQQIAALQHSVKVTEGEVAALNLERQRWKDPAYIASEARERLYYVKPGDVVYLVIDDLPASRAPQEQAAVSKHVEQTKTDWASQLVASVAQAGTAQVAVTK